MKEHKRTEEQQKDYILKLFSKCRSEIVLDRLQGSSEDLCKEIYNWYKDYLSVDVNNIGLGLVEVIIRFTKNISKIPDDKEGFFKYLNASINNEKAASYREYNENDTKRIPKEIKRIKREIEDLIEMLESQLGRKSTTDEKIQFISKWKKVTNKKAIELLELININVSSLDVKNINGEENNILDSENLKPPYKPHPYEEPESAFFTNLNDSIIIEAVKFVLDNKHEKTRDCYKALFTLYCIKNDLKELYPILDQEILDSFHNDGKKPKQYEIYMKYHPEVDQKSAEPTASTNLREFLNDIKTCLKAKNH